MGHPGKVVYPKGYREFESPPLRTKNLLETDPYPMFSYFFLVFIATLLITRIFLYFRPIASPTVGSFRLHHYMYGVVGMILGIAFNILTLFAIGLGLFIDELTYLLIGGKTHEDNYSKTSLIGTLIFVIIFFFTQTYLLDFFNFI